MSQGQGGETNLVGVLRQSYDRGQNYLQLPVPKQLGRVGLEVFWTLFQHTTLSIGCVGYFEKTFVRFIALPENKLRRLNATSRFFKKCPYFTDFSKIDPSREKSGKWPFFNKFVASKCKMWMMYSSYSVYIFSVKHLLYTSSIFQYHRKNK